MDIARIIQAKKDTLRMTKERTAIKRQIRDVAFATIAEIHAEVVALWPETEPIVYHNPIALQATFQHGKAPHILHFMVFFNAAYKWVVDGRSPDRNVVQVTDADLATALQKFKGGMEAQTLIER
jgi:hypothetical protein